MTKSMNLKVLLNYQITIIITILKPIVTFEGKIWTLSEGEKLRLNICERKILKKDIWTKTGARNMKDKNEWGSERVI